uniref:Uncharacterized protein n=1 Tax=Poecilia reticulata TaxID=8081 RepID=A0A3P9PX86_POERE
MYFYYDNLGFPASSSPPLSTHDKHSTDGTSLYNFVSEKRCEEVPLRCPVGAKLTIGSLEDTEYKDRPAVVNGWGKFYLPKPTKMEVIGYAKGTTYPCDQLVLMTCEDQKVYGFDGEELHLVASSPRQMVREGIADPASQSYYPGEAFKDMVSDWLGMCEH